MTHSSMRGHSLRLTCLACVGIAALLLAAAGCSATKTTPTATAVPTMAPTPLPQPIDLLVMYSSDTVGYTDPCG